MKKTVRLLSIMAVIVAGCTACGQNAIKNTADDSGKVKVMTSFYTMYDFAQKIGGEKVEITNMVPSGTEPHDWEPSAIDIRNMEDADVFIYNGAGMEHWAEDILKSLDNSELITVEASEGVELIKEGKENDPHVWLDPENAKIEMEHIKDAFIKADKDNAEYYNENYETCSRQLDELNQEFKETLSQATNKDIIVAHKAFAYLCKAYGLNQIAIEGLMPDSEPDPARMEEIIQLAKKKKINTIFFEELVSPKVANTIAKEIGAKTEVLNPLEGLSEEQMDAGEDYFSVMRTNLKQIKKALEN